MTCGYFPTNRPFTLTPIFFSHIVQAASILFPIPCCVLFRRVPPPHLPPCCSRDDLHLTCHTASAATVTLPLPPHGRRRRRRPRLHRILDREPPLAAQVQHAPRVDGRHPSLQYKEAQSDKRIKKEGQITVSSIQLGTFLTN
jgi:hypothetical protein